MAEVEANRSSTSATMDRRRAVRGPAGTWPTGGTRRGPPATATTTDPRQRRIDATHAAHPRASPRHRPHPRLPLRRRLSQSGPERRAAQLPLLLLHVRGGGRGPGARRAPARGRTPCERVRRLVEPSQSAQRPHAGRGDRAARHPSLVLVGECAERRTARHLGPRGSLPVLRRRGRGGGHRLHGGRPSRHRRADGALPSREPGERPPPRAGGRGHQGRSLRACPPPDPAGRRARPVPDAAPRHPRDGPARRTPGSARPSTTRPPARRGSWSAPTTTSGSRTRRRTAWRRWRRKGRRSDAASAMR